MDRLIRVGFLSEDISPFEHLYYDADSILRSEVLVNPGHVGYSPIKPLPYSLRLQLNDRSIPQPDNFTRITFIIRMLFSA